MTIHLFLSPAASGKTTHLLALVRDAARSLNATPRVVVPTPLQARAWRQRLAETGGALGVRVMIFDRLYAECLDAAGGVYTELSEPVQYRLLRTIVEDLDLMHYKSLADRPGFIHVLQDLIGELKAERAFPDELARAVTEMGGEPRLRELVQIYAAYQSSLRTHAWADRAGLGWLAVESLEKRAIDVGRNWPILVVDGFDDFTAVQIALLKVLADRVGQTIITLTGSTNGDDRLLVHRRFKVTRQRLEAALGIAAEPLPVQGRPENDALAHLETGLFVNRSERIDPGDQVELIEASDRAAEVRAALRWLKTCVVREGKQPGEVALLARSLSAYRPFILQIAREFGLPVRLVDGLPLRSNPAIAALHVLLRLMLPRSDGQPSLPRRLVIEAWRSPYFDWSAEIDSESIGIEAADADALDTAARHGRVIGGWSQWEEALSALASVVPEERLYEERELPARVPFGFDAQVLLDKLRRFVKRLTPPEAARRYRDFVGWLETIIGADAQSARSDIADEPASLRMVERVRTGGDEIAEWDIAALQALKDVLRGLVWAEEAVINDEEIDFTHFFNELSGAIGAATYHPPYHPDQDAILVTDAVQARGVSFRAVAVLGMAEGEFPAVIGEDPFLRDFDRRRLRDNFGFSIDESTESAEAEFFYETITRPRERLLLTRPRLADNGAEWQASPYWEEVRRLLNVEPVRLTSESVPLPDQVASWSELMACISAYPELDALRQWVKQIEPDRLASLDVAASLLRARSIREAAGPFDGDLSDLSSEFTQSFGSDHVWSASRLEKYRACPFSFFVGSVLKLEPRLEPSEGLDARQLGSIYHRILDELFKTVADKSSLDQQLAALDAVADPILDTAPQYEGFRETAWWVQTRAEIVENIRSSLQALVEETQSFVLVYFEKRFFGAQALVIDDAGDQLRLHGVIDRIDRDAEGRLRIIDYKTAGPSMYTERAMREGKKIQLALYARAARDALALGEVAEGFYWHIRNSEASTLKLSKYDEGVDAALDDAVERAREIVRGVRGGQFAPEPPAGGCPDYCPAAAFCWRYRPGY